MQTIVSRTFTLGASAPLDNDTGRTYDPASAEAWARTLAFFQARLG